MTRFSSLQSPAGRRFLFIGGHLLALGLVWLVVVEPVRQFLAERDESLLQRRTTLARYESVARQTAAIEAYAQQVAESNAQGELVAGDNPGIVAANLQARVKQLAESGGVTVRSIQLLPAKTLKGASLVGARMEVAGSLEATHALVRALEGEAPLLLVTGATLRNQQLSWGFMAGPPGEITIDAQIEVYGGALVKERS